MYGQGKVEHVLAYSVLGLFFSRSFKKWRSGLSGKQALLVTLLALAYGIFDEMHQYFVPGRDASLTDLGADVMGGMLAALLPLKRYPVHRH